MTKAKAITKDALKEIRRQGSTKHGMYGSTEYRAWNHMKDRCQNPSSRAFQYYGGRGITVCDKWRNSFQAFLDDVGFRPDPHFTLDRINNQGNYEPGNVRWTDKKTQGRNRRTNRHLVYRGETKTVAEWIEHLSLDEELVRSRLKYGWSVDRIFSLPAKPGIHMITFQGKTKTMSEWSRIIGIRFDTLSHRIKSGWSIERAFLEPVYLGRHGKPSD